jgi:hypothetical protein
VPVAVAGVLSTLVYPLLALRLRREAVTPAMAQAAEQAA